MKCIAVDDEPLALDVLKEYIARVPYLEPLGFFDNPFEALETLTASKPALVFLDIDMPGLSGIQLVRSLKDGPNVVFTTAHPEYALEGFELDAVDYLLKPFGFERFLKAVGKAGGNNTAQTAVQEQKTSLFVQSEHRVLRLTIADIYYIEGYKEYVKIHTSAKQPILTLMSLKILEQELQQNSFRRVHKSFIVNMNRIQEIRGSKIHTKERWIPIGDGYKKSVQRYLERK